MHLLEYIENNYYYSSKKLYIDLFVNWKSVIFTAKAILICLNLIYWLKL